MKLDIFIPNEPRSSRAERIDTGFLCLISVSRATAERAGGNAVLGVEFDTDPFVENLARRGTKLTMTGTMTKLVSA